MARWEVEYTDEFGAWWQGLSEVATRRAMTGGTRNSSRSRTGFMTSILLN